MHSFIYLVTHRFASHCCEALFLRTASAVTEELLGPALIDQKNGVLQSNGSEIYVSIENLFLHALAELEGNVGYLLTDRYALHVPFYSSF